MVFSKHSYLHFGLVENKGLRETSTGIEGKSLSTPCNPWGIFPDHQTDKKCQMEPFIHLFLMDSCNTSAEA